MEFVGFKRSLIDVTVRRSEATDAVDLASKHTHAVQERAGIKLKERGNERERGSKVYDIYIYI